MGKLYVTGTPIGNLGDFSPRAAEVLASVDFIAAEDTRVTLKLLNHFGIKKPLISYFEHNLRERGQMIVQRILAGEDCAIVSDAGMPCVSDPGEDLVRLCAEQGIEVIVIPGPSAAIAALAVSGLSTSRFTFEGFLSTNRPSRMEHLESLKTERRTMIVYEAPHKLGGTLRDLGAALGRDRRVAVCHEITKLHEEVLRMTLGEAEERFADRTLKGEYVLVIEGAPAPRPAEWTLEAAVEAARARTAEGMKPTEAAREAARLSGRTKAEIYQGLLRRREEEDRP